MNSEKKSLIESAVNANRNLAYEALDFLWANPETGYREWTADKYLKEAYSKLGYSITEAGNIPGFTAEVDTGRPGPCIGVFAEMDALICFSHPDSNRETGAVHACGHCCQNAAMLAIAAALKTPGMLDGLCGKIRLIAVPAEEGIEIGFRKELVKKGIISFIHGKPEFVSRGLLDGVDMAFMVHSSPFIGPHEGWVVPGSNGSIIKKTVFKGKAAHAGGSPHNGINALYAATQALSAINNIRETFQEKDFTRVHSIIDDGGESVNIIPDKVSMSTYVRGASVDAMVEANRKVNRAIAGAALSIGAGVEISDQSVGLPRVHDRGMTDVYLLSASEFLTRVLDDKEWAASSTDLGCISHLIPCVHPSMGGAVGKVHSRDFYPKDRESLCLDSAKVQLGMIQILLENDAEKARKIIDDFVPFFKTKEDLLNFLSSQVRTFDAVEYEGNSACVRF